MKKIQKVLSDSGEKVAIGSNPLGTKNMIKLTPKLPPFAQLCLHWFRCQGFPFINILLISTFSFPTQGTSIWVNSLLWEERRQQLSFLEIGFQLVIAVNGCGILSMQGTVLLYHFDIHESCLNFGTLLFASYLDSTNPLNSKQVSWRTKALVVSDWTRRFIFGRDSSSIWGNSLLSESCIGNVAELVDHEFHLLKFVFNSINSLNK